MDIPEEVIRSEERDLGGPPDGGPRYRLRPSIEAFVDRHGALCFIVPGALDRMVREPEALDLALVRLLDEHCESAEALAASLGADLAAVEAKLESLTSAGLVLVRPAPPVALAGEDGERFSRQLLYLAELGEETRLQRRLRDCTVVVIGCGGLGTWAIAALACIGVGRLRLIDDDRVAISNLNRQILYARRDVGAAKVAAAAAWLREFDTAIDVTTYDRRLADQSSVEPMVAGADAVLLAADWPPYELARWVNAACVSETVPFIVAGQVPPLLKIGPFYMPGEGACFTCHETALRQSSHAYDDYVRFRASRTSTTTSTLGPASCVVGGLLALELLHLLTGHAPVTRDASLLVHMRTLELRREPVTRDPDCVACKHLH